MTIRAAFSLLTIALAASVSLRADEEAVSVNKQRLAALKQLAGDWVQVGKDGKPADKIFVSIRVTAAGSVVQETLLPGSDHEMVTMYHLDGADLILTHYCAMGNQPRMKADAGKDVERMVFQFVGGTNLKGKDDQHMHQVTLTLAGKDRYQAEWVSYKEGKSCHQVKFDLARKAK